jgi:pilus assembly protein CpaE
MTGQPGFRAVALARSNEVKSVLASALASQPHAKLEIEVGELAAANSTLLGRLDGAELVLLDLVLDDEREQAMLHRIVAELGGRAAILVTAREVSLPAMRRLMREGVDDCLPQPLAPQDVADAVTAALRKLRRRTGSERPPGKIIGVMRAKGGAGASTLALNLALHLRRPAQRGGQSQEVCLIDLDLQFGDLAIMLDLSPSLDLGEIIRAPHRLDAMLLQSVTTPHASGLKLVPAPAQPAPLEALPPETAARLVELARDAFDCVVLDLPLGLAAWSEPVLAALDQLLVVTRLSVPAIRQTRRFLDLLKEESLFGPRVTLVLNRYVCRFGEAGRIRQSEKALGQGFDFLVHDDAGVALEAANRGMPIDGVAPRSRLNRDLRRIAQAVAVKPAAGERKA